MSLKVYGCTFRGSNSASFIIASRGWSGGAKVLGKLSVPGRPTSLDDSRARDYCACSRCGWGCLDIFSLIYLFSFLSPSLWETARYRLKYCLKGPLSPKQPTIIASHINWGHLIKERFCFFPFIIDPILGRALSTREANMKSRKLFRFAKKKKKKKKNGRKTYRYTHAH